MTVRRKGVSNAVGMHAIVPARLMSSSPSFPNRRSALRLLVHVTFHDRSGRQQARSSDRTMANDVLTRWRDRRANGSGSVLKSSLFWRDHIYETLLAGLTEIDRYHMFQTIHVVVDANRDNAYLERLRTFGRSQLRHTSLEVRPAQSDDLNRAPNRLAWMHRKHMREQLCCYDWFMLLEDDVLVPASTMRTQLRLAERLYRETGRTLSFVRVLYDGKGREFFADLRRRSPSNAFFRLQGLGDFVAPTHAFSGGWAYPKLVMQDFVNRPEWENVSAELDGDVRAGAAAGFVGCSARASRGHGDGSCRGGCQVVTRYAHDLRVYHLSRCGRFYVWLPSTATRFSGSSPMWDPQMRDSRADTPCNPCSRSSDGLACTHPLNMEAPSLFSGRRTDRGPGLFLDSA